MTGHKAPAGDLPDGVVVAATVCPHCGRDNPHHVHASLRPPRDGDYTICWGCRQVLGLTVSPLGVIGVTVLDGPARAEAMAVADVREALAAQAESYTPMQALELRRAGGRFG